MHCKGKGILLTLSISNDERKFTISVSSGVTIPNTSVITDLTAMKDLLNIAYLCALVSLVNHLAWYTSPQLLVRVAVHWTEGQEFYHSQFFHFPMLWTPGKLNKVT